MKKIILLIIVLIFLTAGCGSYDLNNFVLPDDGEFIKVIKSLNTPEKISDYMLNNFIYEAHNFYIPDPYTLWKIKKGDCNDFATFGVFVANYHGYETWQIKIYFKCTIDNHRIAVYKEDGGLSFTDNQYYNRYLPDFFRFNNFRDIVQHNSGITLKVWTKYIVYDYWNNEVETGYNN